MKKPKIISLININGEWIAQDDIPEQSVKAIVESTIIQAARNIGFEVTKIKKEKTA